MLVVNQLVGSSTLWAQVELRTRMSANIRNLETLRKLFYRFFTVPTWSQLIPHVYTYYLTHNWNVATCCKLYLLSKDFLPGVPYSLGVETEHHMHFRFQKQIINSGLKLDFSLFSRPRIAIPVPRVAIPCAPVMACCPSGHADTHGPEARGRTLVWPTGSFHIFLLSSPWVKNSNGFSMLPITNTLFWFWSVLYILLLVISKNLSDIIFLYRPSWSTQLR